MEEHESAKSFKDLLVWQKAHQFVLEVYRLTEKFPSKEIYSLTSQFRRASVSIPANIAEGFRKRGKADKVRYLNIAEGSLQECIYYLILAKDLGYAENSQLFDLVDEIGKMLNVYSHRILSSNS
jgi:four helix bundle protein